MMEVAERRFQERSRFVVIHHQIGQTTIMGAFDSVPTDSQLLALATGADRDAGRPRATIVYQANGGSGINLPVARTPVVPRT